MEVAIKLLFDISAFSSIMVLVVLGLAVIASMMGIFNLGHGEFVLMGAYVVFVFKQLGLPIWMGMMVAPIAVAALGAAIEVIFIRRLYEAPITAMLSTFAIGLTIREIVRVVIHGQYYAIEEPVTAPIALLGVDVSAWRAIIILLTVALMTACFLFLTRTSFGLQIRGALENPSLARGCGVSTSRIYAFTFAFGAALAGLAGALVVPLFSLSADLGVHFLVQAFLSVMLGGVGTFEGPILGSAMVGAMVPGFQWLREIPFFGVTIGDVVQPIVAEVLVFIVALVIVRFRPSGLFTKGRI